MAIKKLTEFAKDGQKDLKNLSLIDGFPVKIKPARQWFNWIFNALTLKINEIIDQKLDTDGTALKATQLEKTCIFTLSGAVTGESTPFNGRSDVVIQVEKIHADKLKGVASISTLGNASTATNLERDRIIEFNGDVRGGFTFGKSENISCELQLLERHASSIAAGGTGTTIPSITINNHGIVTNLGEVPIPTASITRQGIVYLVHSAGINEDSTTKAISQYGASKISEKIPGLEQSWRNVDRAMSTVYTNLGARPITIALTVYRCSVRVIKTGGSAAIFNTVGDEAKFLSLLIPYNTSYEILPKETGAKIIESAELL